MPNDEGWVPRQFEDIRRQIRELGPSVAKSFRSTVAKLQAQTDYLASLKTFSAGNATFNTGTVAGDQTWRYFDAPTPLKLDVTAPTGRVRVTAGCGQVTLDPGETSAIASVTFQVTTPLGWTYPIGYTDARLFTTADRMLGIPLIVEAPISVSDWEVNTFTAKFGMWSASTTTLASAQFDNAYINVQVIDA